MREIKQLQKEFWIFQVWGIVSTLLIFFIIIFVMFGASTQDIQTDTDSFLFMLVTLIGISVLVTWFRRSHVLITDNETKLSIQSGYLQTPKTMTIAEIESIYFADRNAGMAGANYRKLMFRTKQGDVETMLTWGKRSLIRFMGELKKINPSISIEEHFHDSVVAYLEHGDVYAVPLPKQSFVPHIMKRIKIVLLVLVIFSVFMIIALYFQGS